MAKGSPNISQRRHRQYIAQAAVAEYALTTLKPQAIEHIRAAWDESRAAPGDFATDLYAHFFAISPAAARLFPGDLSQQRQRLTRTLTESLALLDKPQDLLLLLRASGVRHVHYQTDFEHFPLLGAALDKTLRQRLGEQFTAARRSSWHLLYSSMAAVMCGAMATTLRERA